MTAISDIFIDLFLFSFLLINNHFFSLLIGKNTVTETQQRHTPGTQI